MSTPTLKRLNRLLVHPDMEAVFRSADPDDQRLGNFLTPVTRLPLDTCLTCVIVGSPQHIGIERNGGRPGAEGGPDAIRYWLQRMATADVSGELQSGRLRLVDAGNLRPGGLTLQQIHDEQHDVVLEIIEHGMIPIVLGGGHDTAWPTISALESDGESYAVINIDAHADVRPLKNGTAAHSGSPFRQMLDQDPSCLTPGGFVEFGLQHYAVSAAHRQLILDAGHHVYMLDSIRQQGAHHAWRQALEHTQSADRVYVTLDMDGFASAFAPGVSAPSADGFTPSEIGPALRMAARDERFSAFDVVELSPPFDVDNRTAKLAATMIMQVLAGLADRTAATVTGG